MAQLSTDEIEQLTRAIHAHDYLARLVSEIEELHRVVFHANPHADWSLVRRSAEQIVIAEIIYRHRGQPEEIHQVLRAMEGSGQTWEAAIGELAAGIHSYYTTPLGLVMRQDLFGPAAVFITPDAYEWTAQLKGRESPAKEGTP